MTSQDYTTEVHALYDLKLLLSVHVSITYMREYVLVCSHGIKTVVIVLKIVHIK